MAYIFVVEDNAAIREAVVSYLRLENHELFEADNLAQARRALRKRPPDLIVLDIMLPDGNGFAFAKTLRTELSIPIIFLTAKTEESDRITGFELGADDYITKPFSPRELVLRVNAVLKRAVPAATAAAAALRFQLDQDVLLIDEEAHRVTINSREITLTAAEWKILIFLARHAGMVVHRETLLEECLDYRIADSYRTIDTHIKNLRAKLERPGWIETLRAFGYRFSGKMP
ncbi:MAG TPA: response regulator transcription factor [Spirochaetia bacterium]|nr:response regulator transcription factor [Spirochaetia bacterium]